MTPLRNKMEGDLILRNLAPTTARQYIRHVAAFAAHFGRSPAVVGTDEVRATLLHLRERGLSPSTMIVVHSALSFLYRETLAKPEVMQAVPRPRAKRPPQGLPLMRSEVAAVLDAAGGDPRAYTIAATLLGTGLRLSELCTLQTGDLDSKGGLLHVRHGKGDKARAVQLVESHLRLLRRYWTVLRPPGPWVFPAQRLVSPGRVDLQHRWADRPIGQSTVQKILAELGRKAGLKRRLGPHDLRRTYGTWLSEAGVKLSRIQVLLGHASPETTTRYIRVHPDLIRQTPSPLEMV